MSTDRYLANPHRHNPNGSIDSICITCFATIARSGDEAALSAQEKKHSCDRQVLAYREPDRLKMKMKAHPKIGGLRRLTQTVQNRLRLRQLYQFFLRPNVIRQARFHHA
jgi:hypothetical protein